jgi:hypothetical protein
MGSSDIDPTRVGRTARRLLNGRDGLEEQEDAANTHVVRDRRHGEWMGRDERDYDFAERADWSIGPIRRPA